MKNIFCSYFLWHLVHWIRDDLGVTASVCYFHTAFSNQSLHLDIHGWRISHVERNLCKVSNVTLIFPAEIRTPLSQQDEWRGNWDLREISYTHIAGSDSGTVALCHHNMVALASLPRLSWEDKEGFTSLSVLKQSMNILLLENSTDIWQVNLGI